MLYKTVLYVGVNISFILERCELEKYCSIVISHINDPFPISYYYFLNHNNNKQPDYFYSMSQTLIEYDNSVNSSVNTFNIIDLLAFHTFET